MWTIGWETGCGRVALTLGVTWYRLIRCLTSSIALSKPRPSFCTIEYIMISANPKRVGELRVARWVAGMAGVAGMATHRAAWPCGPNGAGGAWRVNANSVSEVHWAHNHARVQGGSLRVCVCTHPLERS